MGKITFFGGICEIGGNKILLEDGDTSVFLDFGMSFREHGQYFEEYLKPRTANGFGDFLELRLIPWMEGIYRKDLLSISKLPEHDEPVVDGVLLSHMHLDHSSYISFLDENIPVYCSDVSRTMAQALIDCGTRSMVKEICNYKERPIKPGCKPVCRTLKKEKEFSIGNLTVKAFPVDHSVPGSLAYLIYAPEGVLVYTGDLRLHGTENSQTQQSIEKIKDETEKVDVLLCEGTNVGSGIENSEKDVETNSNKVVSKTEQLVIADFSCKDVTRLNTFLEVAKANDRKLGICLKDVCLYKLLKKVVPNLPSIDDSDIIIFKPKMKTGRYANTDYPKCLRDFLNLENTKDAAYIHEHQSELILCMGFYEINHLVDVKPNPGSVYIHSSSEAFNEEMRIDEERLNNWLDHFELQKNHFHASGHAGACDLKEIIEDLKPKKVVPIHTEKPELFKCLTSNSVLVEKGGSIAF